jgi:hypothetical protein
MRRRIVALAACLLSAGACTDNGTGPGSELQIEAPSRQLVEGQELTLAVLAGGQRVEARDVAWSSSDPTTVRVTNGVVRGVAPGVAYVRARSGLARDSVEINVRFSTAATAGMAVRIAGTSSEIIRMRGAGMILQPIGLTSQHLQLRAGNSRFEASLPLAGEGDSLLHVNVPGPIAVGVTTLNPLVVDWPSFHFTGGSGAFFRIRDNSTRIRFYAPVTPPRLEIHSIQMPSEAGNVTGLITGSIWFEAAGLVTDYDEERMVSSLLPLADTTIAVYAEFVTPIYHILTPRISLSLTGGPDAEPILTGAVARVNGGGLSIELNGYPASSGATVTKIFQGSVWIPSPHVGTVTIGQADARVLTDSIGAMSAWARFSSRPLVEGVPGTPLHAFSESGTMTISAYQAPTNTGFGRIDGQLTVTLRYPADAPVQGSTVLTAQFALPVNPLQGHPLDDPRW